MASESDISEQIGRLAGAVNNALGNSASDNGRGDVNVVDPVCHRRCYRLAKAVEQLAVRVR